MAVIYSITNLINGKRYIGKTTHPKQRWYTHKYRLTQPKMDRQNVNRHLYNSVQKNGIENFKYEILEEIKNPKEKEMRVAELKWMDHFKTCDREHGYNLRRDSSTKCFMADETKRLMSEAQTGSKNGNYGNKWDKKQKDRMSRIAKERHASGKYYSDEWKTKIAMNSTKMWKDEKKKKSMTQKLKIKKRKYRFNQYTKEGLFVKQWESVEEIIEKHPDWKWQNIYSVCNGYKPTYQNFIWKKTSLNEQTPIPKNIKGFKPQFRFDQFSRDGKFIKRWGSYEEIKLAFPNQNCGNIYRVCNGKTPTALNYIWKKVISNDQE